MKYRVELKMAELRYIDELAADVRRITYDFARRHGEIYLDEDSFVDLGLGPDYFRNIDQEVRSIAIFNEDADGRRWEYDTFELVPGGDQWRSANEVEWARSRFRVVEPREQLEQEDVDEWF